jgi:TetR/AcrR family fatty acid metabolism transcriptional regulator
VAEEAGMARSSLYHYYPSKESLLAELVPEMLEQEMLLFRSHLTAEGEPVERLVALARASAAAIPQWSEFGRLILDLRLEDAKQLRGFFRDLRRETAAVIAEGQADGSIVAEPDAKAMASIWIGAIDGLLLQYFVDARDLPGRDALAEALAATTRRLLEA